MTPEEFRRALQDHGIELTDSADDPICDLL
jgi:hypothetical protein